jgi:hypothetical protein
LDHIDNWNYGYQYSSHVTQAFWVPQHAIAGWTCAITFLLWRKRVTPVGPFAASIPLVAIWSPLAIMGAVPFALLAGAEVLRHRGFSLNDIALGAFSLAISTPALIYLQIDAAEVGMHLRHTKPEVLAFCALLEVLPFAWPLLRRRSPDVDRPVILLILILLLVMPLIQIGVSSDFQMRASIMPLALLAIAFAKWTAKLSWNNPADKPAIIYALLALALGAPTPLLELRRAVINGPSPPPLCSLVGAWYKQDGLIAPFTTYLAPVGALPNALASIPITAGLSDPAQCWDRGWVIPNSG